MDKRVEKTKRLICTTLIELLAEKNYMNVTITELAEKCNVNRKTIYTYYSNISDILNEIESKIIASIDNLIKNIDTSITLKNPLVIFEYLSNVFSNNFDFYTKLLRISGVFPMSIKLVNLLKDNVKKTVIEKHLIDPSNVNMVVDYVITGALNAYKNWFNSGMQMPMEKFSKRLSDLVFLGTNKYLITR